MIVSDYAPTTDWRQTTADVTRQIVTDVTKCPLLEIKRKYTLAKVIGMTTPETIDSAATIVLTGVRCARYFAAPAEPRLAQIH
jgi:hypothetical protein